VRKRDDGSRQVNSDWRAMGVPFWLSFAFWQWLAVAMLGTGFGHLVLARDPRSTRRHARSC
jgi:hypothetical protein